MRLLIGMLILSACAGAPPATRSTDDATPLPTLTLPRLAGGTWDSTTARGSVLVIDVWASWCKPCGKSFASLDALAARHPNVAIVAVSIDEDPQAAHDFLVQFPLHVPAVQDAQQLVTHPPIGVTRLPTVLIVDKNGVIRHRVEEPSAHDYEHLDSLLE